jgi:small conductance mechanosensitive channel
MNEWLNKVKWEEISEKIVNWMVETIPAVLLVFLLGFILFRIWAFIGKKFKKLLLRNALRDESKSKLEAEKRVDTLSNILNVSVRLAIWAILIMMFLKQIDIDIGPLIASLGIVGLALGFGAQELVRDVVTGFFILLENHIRTGDVAIINGTGGLVENIGLRTMTLRDLSGVVHVFQNGKINTLSNMTKEWSAMVFDVGVAYKEDTDKVSQIIREVGDELQKDPAYQEKIIEPLEIFGVDRFGDSAVVIKARIKTQPIQQWSVGREFNRRLKMAFDEKGIEIPFPHRTIYWGDEIKPLKAMIEQRDLQKDFSDHSVNK